MSLIIIHKLTYNRLSHDWGVLLYVSQSIDICSLIQFTEMVFNFDIVILKPCLHVLYDWNSIAAANYNV